MICLRDNHGSLSKLLAAQFEEKFEEIVEIGEEDITCYVCFEERGEVCEITCDVNGCRYRSHVKCDKIWSGGTKCPICKQPNRRSVVRPAHFARYNEGEQNEEDHKDGEQEMGPQVPIPPWRARVRMSAEERRFYLAHPLRREYERENREQELSIGFGEWLRLYEEEEWQQEESVRSIQAARVPTARIEAAPADWNGHEENLAPPARHLRKMRELEAKRRREMLAKLEEEEEERIREEYYRSERQTREAEERKRMQEQQKLEKLSKAPTRDAWD
jgi:hypothetical protein